MNRREFMLCTAAVAIVPLAAPEVPQAPTLRFMINGSGGGCNTIMLKASDEISSHVWQQPDGTWVGIPVVNGVKRWECQAAVRVAVNTRKTAPVFTFNV